MLFLHTKNELTEKEIWKAISFTLVSRKIKYLGINVTKEVKASIMKNISLKKESEISGKEKISPFAE